MKTPAQEFVLNQRITNVLTFMEYEKYNGPEREFFGVPWQFVFIRQNNYLGIYLKCAKSLEEDDWSIDAKYKITIMLETHENLSKGNRHIWGTHHREKGFTARGHPDFVEWETMKKQFLTDGVLELEAHVKIKKMVGFTREPVLKFDEEVSSGSIAVIIMGEKKFHVLKPILAANSFIFKNMFSENPNQTEFVYNKINAEHFQFFLETVYGNNAIDDNTVNGILNLADQFDSKDVMKKCEAFLVQESKKTSTQRKSLIEKYKLEACNVDYIRSIRNPDDVKVVTPSDIGKMDRSELELLLEKTLTLI